MGNRQDRRRDKKFRNQVYRDLMKEARRHLDADRLREAELGFKEAAAEAPDAAEPHHMLAHMAYGAGRLEEAGNHIVEAAMRAEDDVAINADCGAIMNMLGRPAEAEAACRHVIDLDPDHVEAYNNLSVALSLQNRRDEALEVCEAALERRPDYADALVNKANLLVKMDDPVGAIEAFAEAIRVAPENPLARVNLGTALRMVGELEAAEEQCRLGIELRPDYPEAHAGFGTVLAARGDFAGAIAAFREALKLRPGFGAAQMNLAAAQFKSGDLAAAKTAYLQIIADHPEAGPAQTGLGIVLLADGNLDGAAAAFRAAVDLDPGEGEAWMNLASALGAEMPAEDIAKMSELAEDTRLAADQRIAIRFALGEICDRRGEFDAAFAHYRRGNDARKAALAALGKVYDPDAMTAVTDQVRETFRPGFLEAAAAGDPEAGPVFIVGMPRSGTTLVEQILASHPGVHGAGELGAVAAEAPAFPDGVDGMDMRGAAEAVRRRMHALAPDAARIVDKAPFQFLHVGLIRLMFPGAQIIHCRRDPLDTGLSCFFQNFVADYPWATDLAEIGRYMNAYEAVMAHWRAVLPGAMHEVDYEALVADPEAESRALIDYLGLPWDDACLRSHETRRPVLTASNWQVRRPVYGSSKGRAGHYEKHLVPLRAALA